MTLDPHAKIQPHTPISTAVRIVIDWFTYLIKIICVRNAWDSVMQ